MNDRRIRKINIREITGAKIETVDNQTSASGEIIKTRFNQPSILQRGEYALTGGTKLVTFPQIYTSGTQNLQVLLTSDTANQQFLQGIVTSAFTVSGSGTDTGRWLSIGYK